MSGNDQKFKNPFSGEELIHHERKDGSHALFITTPEHSDETKGEAAFGPDGKLSFLRDLGGDIIADDKK